MNDFAVTCTATGDAVDPVRLGSQLSTLLLTLKEFGPIGRFANDGTRFQSTLIIPAESAADASRIALHAVTMAVASAGLPSWPLDVTACFALAA